MTTETKVLRRLFKDEVIKLPANNGRTTIIRATDVFTSYLDRDFKKLDKRQKPTPETEVEVYEMVKDATFKQMADQFCQNPNKPDEICLTQSQIVDVCKNKTNKLHPKGATFLFFKQRKWWQFKVRYFVAIVYVRSDDLYVGVTRFERFEGASVWGAKDALRLVTPTGN